MVNVKMVVNAMWSTWLITSDVELRPDITFGPEWNAEALARLRSAIEETGFIELIHGCPTGLLAMAQYRQTGPDNEVDRVYGIMQVFGLQVGKSRPGVQPCRDFTLEELEDDLGSALMEKDPILSQLYIYRTPPPLGKGWRVTKESRPTDKFDIMCIELGYDALDRSSLRKTVAMSRLSTV